MTLDEVITVAQAAGWTGDQLANAVAIAWAESGLDSSNISDIDNPHAGCRSYGLWQINFCPDRDTGSRPDPSVLLTPAGNAQFAHSLSQAGTNWHPWTVYNIGTYLVYLPRVKAELARLAGGGAPTGPSSPTPPTDGGISGIVSGIVAGIGSILTPNGGFPSIPSGANASLQPCLDACKTRYPILNDATTPGNFDNRTACYRDCYTSYGPTDQTAAQTEAEIACGQCGVTNISACFDCASAYLTKGLVTIGINLLLGIVVLLGIYLLFKDPIDRTAGEAVKAAPAVLAA